MALTSRSPTSLSRVSDKHKNPKIVLIATEGELTERQYFNGVFPNPSINFEVFPTGKDGKSAPKYVLERLDDCKAKYEVIPSDELWLMIDVDRWPERNLRRVRRRAKKKGFKLAVSNPCFELWLYLHLADVNGFNGSCKDVKSLLRGECGGSYNSSNVDSDTFAPLVQDAIDRAKALHSNPKERWPDTAGSHVYKVAESLQ